MAVTDALIGTLFDGRYKVVRRLGAGGMANVYLAEDQELGRRVAIKILNDRHAHDEQFVERFRREAKNAAGLSHPNVVSIYDRGEAEGTYYIAMEYLDGRSLKELIVSRGPAPIPVAIDYARQILAALRFAHRNGIVHRDIKPHNVLVDGEGRVKVTDFGIARAGAASQMTEAGSIVGTAQYLSPEQAKGTAVDQRSDIYSLGIVLYELLTGSVPFTGDTPVEIAMKHISETPVPPSSVRPDVPHDLDLVVTRALAKDPAERYQSAEEMDADLERVLRGAAIARETEESATQILSAPTTVMSATQATAVKPPPRRSAPPGYPPPPPPVYYDYDEPIRRRPIWPWLLALLFVVAAGIGGYFLYNQISSQISSDKPVAVDIYTGLRTPDAMAKIHSAGLRGKIDFRPSPTVAQGFVFGQSPDPGTRVNKGNQVTITVSTGKPKTDVPEIVGKTETDAVAALTAANLRYKALQVPSNSAAGQVLAQDPKPGVQVTEGTLVHFTVSKGPTPVSVPSVVGVNVATANSTLQGAGFKVGSQTIDSNQPKDTVVRQDPAGGSSAAKGTTVTIFVSKGPKTSTVPDVQSYDKTTAGQTLHAAGFNVRVTWQDTTDPSQDGIVLSQDPQGGAEQKPGTVVTLTVGRLVTQTDTTDTTTTP
ncbi:MAG: Stk1 family PASTA domain-containing Ser/Thr kinase [Actinobacteria bacterium]|nr:MAG: Stk1 family PASTA domain-containing Ser/Thr kinase [Actinomycetota bacterium]